MRNLDRRITKIEQALAQAGGAFGPEDQVGDEQFMKWTLWTRHRDYPRPELTTRQQAYCRSRLDELMDSIAAAGREYNFKPPVYSEEDIRRMHARLPDSLYEELKQADRLAATETHNPQ